MRAQAKMFAHASEELGQLHGGASADHEELVLPPKPMDPRRHRGFLICSTLTIALVVGGWITFFADQVSQFGEVVPAAVTSPAMNDLLEGFSGLDEETTAVVGKDFGEGVADVVNPLQAAANRTVVAGTILDEMKARLTEEEAEPAPESIPAPSEQP